MRAAPSLSPIRLNLLRLLAFDALWGDWLRIVQLWAGSMSLRMAVPVFSFRVACTVYISLELVALS